MQSQSGEEGISGDPISESTIERLIRAGARIFRINLSHGHEEDNATIIRRLRLVSKRLGARISVMVDIPSRKYRTGPTTPDVIVLRTGDEFTLTSRGVTGDESIVSVFPDGIHRDADPYKHRRILIDDGALELQVEHVEGSEVRSRVIGGGSLTKGRGVAIPGRSPSLPFPDENVVKCLEFAARHADIVAISMVQVDGDVRQARKTLRSFGVDLFIVSKIETREALENFDSILKVSDGIMVARGDLGVNMDRYGVPFWQKKIIARSNEEGKPVITATQMLESMLRSREPTRAEVADVANAVLDGTDALMLSGETATGWFPVEAVRVMASAALEAEKNLMYDDILGDRFASRHQRADDAISYSAVCIVHSVNAKAIVAFTKSGSTAAKVSRYRPKSPVLALTPTEHILGRLALYWGVIPTVVPTPKAGDDFFEIGKELAQAILGLQSGDSIVLVAGLPLGVPGSTNLLHQMQID